MQSFRCTADSKTSKSWQQALATKDPPPEEKPTTDNQSPSKKEGATAYLERVYEISRTPHRGKTGFLQEKQALL